MAYLDQLAALDDLSFLLRVSGATVKAAQAVRNEATDTPFHKARVALAVRVANEHDALRTQFARLLVVAASPLVTTASTDAALDTAVSQVWNTLAGE